MECLIVMIPLVSDWNAHKKKEFFSLILLEELLTRIDGIKIHTFLLIINWIQIEWGSLVQFQWLVDTNT